MSAPKSLLLALWLGLAVLPLTAPAQSAADKDAKLSDSERAKRDADKVFSFIKFHTVRSAPAPAPAPARPAATRSLNVAAAPASQAINQAVGSAVPAAERAAAAVATDNRLASPSGSSAEPTVTTADLPAETHLAGTGALSAAPLQAAPQVEAEETPLRLLDYVPPDMTAQVLAAMPGNAVSVPVRFVVQPDGRVSSAQAMGSAPRRVAQAAVRAVQQWRFDRLPAERTVDVEIAFRAE